MARTGKITDFFSIEDFEEQKKQVSDGVKEYIDLVQKVPAIRVEIRGAETTMQVVEGMKKLDDTNKKIAESTTKVIDISKKLTQSQQQLNKTLTDTVKGAQDAIDSYKELLQVSVQNQLAIKQFAEARRQLDKDFKAGKISIDEYNKSAAEIEEKQIALKASQSEVAKTLKNIQKESLAASGSIEEMDARLTLLQQTYGKLTNEEKASPIGKQIQKDADSLSNKINQQKKSVGDFTDNIGRYAESLGAGFKLVADQIDNLKQKQADLISLQQTDPSGFSARGGTEELQRAASAISQLEQVQKVGLNTNQSYTKTVRQLETEYRNLATSGNVSNDFLQEFAKFVAESKREAQDLSKNINKLSSETQTLDAISGVARTFVSAFEAGAGAVELFTGENKHAEEAIRNLIAIQSVATGVREIFKEATEKGTIANKAYNVVVQQATILFSKGTSAAQRFGTALKGIAVLAVIGILTDLISKFTSSKDVTEQAAKALELYNEQLRATKELQGNLDKGEESRYKNQIEQIKTLNQQRTAAAKTDLDKIKVESDNRKNLFDAEVNFRADNIKTIQQRQQQAQDEEIKQQKKYDGLNLLQKKIGNTANLKEVIKGQFDILESSKKANSDLQQQLIDARNGRIQFIQQNNQQVIQEEEKLRDELRKIAIEDANLNLEIISTKNEKILSDERSTLQQRIDAIEKIKDAQLKAAQVQRDNSTSPLANKEYEAAALKITSDAEQKRFETKETFRIRDLNAQKEANDTRLKREIDLNKALSDSDILSVETRLKANQVYLQKQAELNKEDFELQLKTAGFSDQKIKAIEQGQQVEVKGTKLTLDELTALRVNYENKNLELVKEGNDNVYTILQSDLEKQTKLREEKLNDLQRIYDSVDLKTSTDYSQDIIDLNNSLKEKKISLNEYNKEREKIEKSYSIQSSQNLIKSLNEQLNALKSAGDKEEEIKRNLQAKKALLDKAEKDGASKDDILELTKQVDKLQKEYDNEKTFADKKKDLLKQLNDAKQQLSDQEIEIDKNLIEQKKELYKGLYEQLTTAVQDYILSGIDKQKEGIQAEIDLLDQKTQKEIDAANQTITNERDKEQAVAEINARSAAEKNRLEIQQKQLDIKRANAEKAFNVLRILIDTATKVFQIKAQASLLASNPVTLPYVPIALSQIPLVIAGGALAAALVAAQRVPSYFKETDNHPRTGPAIVGEVPEVITEPSKGSYLISKPTFIPNLEKGSTVYHADRFIDNALPLIGNKIMSNVVAKTESGPMPVFNDKNLISELKGLKKSIDKLPTKMPQTTITGEPRYKVMTRQGHVFRDYLNKNL